MQWYSSQEYHPASISEVGKKPVLMSMLVNGFLSPLSKLLCIKSQ